MAQQNPWQYIDLPNKAGINRDGSDFSSDVVIDAQFMRWFYGRWLKMGGYYATLLSPASPLVLVGPVRELHGFWGDSSGYVHSGSIAKLERIMLNSAGVSSAVTDRTPVGFAANAANNWMFDQIYDSVGSQTTLIAHCTTNLADITAGALTSIYYGDVMGTSALTSTGQSVDGGIACLQPYLFGFGNNGVVWTVANKPNDWTSTGSSAGNPARISGTKVIKGLPARGASNGPAGLFWSLNSLVRCTFVGGAPVFSFQTISERTSVLSTRGIVESDGRFFWPGIDRMFVYDGSLREMRNERNIAWFYNNLNYTWRQKVWARYDQSYGEIWWHFPYGEATECTHAIIYNTRENEWYDTELSRSAGIHSTVYRYPLLSDNENNATLWQHERGVDQNVAGVLTAIPWHIESRVFAMSQMQDGNTQANWIYVDSIEPDFKTQTEDMTLVVRGREYARSSLQVFDTKVITPTTERVDLRAQGREIRFRFAGDAVNSNIESGRTLIRMRVGDGQ